MPRPTAPCQKEAVNRADRVNHAAAKQSLMNDETWPEEDRSQLTRFEIKRKCRLSNSSPQCRHWIDVTRQLVGD